MIARLVLFFILNFGALTLGALLMGENPGENNWYQGLNKAPWTPPGWMFGVAWTIIMVCFSFYMAMISVNFKGKLLQQLGILFILQWILNVGWNPVFFHFNWVLLGAIMIFLLIIVLVSIQLNFGGKKLILRLLIFPYLIWLIVAFSMNVFVLVKN